MQERKGLNDDGEDVACCCCFKGEQNGEFEAAERKLTEEEDEDGERNSCELRV